jgi:hypothetical protein
MLRYCTLLIVPALCLGCASDSDNSGTVWGDDVGRVRQNLPGGYADPSVVNHSGLRHSDGGTGIVVDHTRDGRRIKTYDANHVELGDVDNCDGPGGPAGSCRAIRVQTLEQHIVGSKTMFRVWAGGSSNDGWIELDDVATVGRVTEQRSARAGNGDSCASHGIALVTDTAGQPVRYVVTPTTIASPSGGRKWRLDSSGDEWYLFSPDWDKPHGPNRAFLFWSWTPTDDTGINRTDFAGGGVARAEMRAGDFFTPCKVAPIPTVLRAGDASSTTKPALNRAYLMTVYGAYGQFTAGGHTFYGWTIIASVLNSTGACQMHVRCDGGAAKCPLLPLLPSTCHF